jgi:hypothetical protein
MAILLALQFLGKYHPAGDQPDPEEGAPDQRTVAIATNCKPDLKAFPQRLIDPNFSTITTSRTAGGFPDLFHPIPNYAELCLTTRRVMDRFEIYFARTFRERLNRLEADPDSELAAFRDYLRFMRGDLTRTSRAALFSSGTECLLQSRRCRPSWIRQPTSGRRSIELCLARLPTSGTT